MVVEVLVELNMVVAAVPVVLFTIQAFHLLQILLLLLQLVKVVVVVLVLLEMMETGRLANQEILLP